MLRIGNYARKSVYSDTSDSTEVQFSLGAEYCKSHYSDYEIFKYEDEGYTGANTNRPGYTQLVNDVKNGNLDVVLCYKIDRISRDVLDFSNFFSLLSANNVEFASIKEQIDTSTPLGRAMMYICSVFAQMERETIAERVTDNMIELSKSGKWAGGRAPVGYERKKVELNGKTHTVLCENPSETAFLNMIFNTFLDGNFSLNGLETHFRNTGVKTINGNYLSGSQLYNILKNPHYAPADADTLNYFKSLGCTIGCEESKFDGTHGIVAYGRTSGGRKKKHMLNSADKWTISVGLHTPLISSETWLTVQSRFGQNTIDKTRKHKVGILKGVLRCSCGCLMRVQHKVDKKSNKVYDSYFCQNRNRRGKEFCNRAYTPVSVLDNAVIDILKEIKLDKKIIDEYIYEDKTVTPFYRSKLDIQKDIDKINDKIGNLTSTLSQSLDSPAAKYIVSEIEKLDKNLTGLKFELMEHESIERKQAQAQSHKDNKYEMVSYIVDSLESADYNEINGLLKKLMIECFYNGKQLHIKM